MTNVSKLKYLPTDDNANAGFDQDTASLGTAADSGSADNGGSAGNNAQFASIPTLANYLTQGYFVWDGENGKTHYWATPTVTVNITALTAGEQALAISALNAYHEVANISFSFTTGAAQITYNHNGSGIANTNWNYDNSGHMTSATVDISSDWSSGTDIYSYMYQTYIHETGHALGLGHQGAYNNTATYGVDNVYSNDTWQYSVMSYFSQNNFGGGTYDYVITPEMADIYAVQSLYGANNNTRSGNTTYGFNSNAGSLYDFNHYNGTPAFTIYDTGGYDTLDASGYSMDQTINLTPGSWSSIGGYTNNIGIYTNTTIEYAYGGSGNDTITGNDADNYLSGGNGNDSIKGGGGTDTLVGGAGDDTLKGGGGNDYLYGGTGTNTAEYNDNLSAYTLSETANGLIVTGSASGDGVDTLHQIQKLSFKDVVITDDYFGDTSTTGTIASGGSVHAGMQFQGDHDWFKVQLTAGHNYVIDERGFPSGGGTLPDTYVRLHNASGTEIAHDDDSGAGLDSELAVHVTTTGTYYIDAGSYADYYTGTYTVDFQDVGTSRFAPASLTLAQFGTANSAGGWTSENQYTRELGDVNGDGLADIVGFGVHGTYVSLATGDGHFAAPSLSLAQFGTDNSVGGWTSQDQYTREIADVNGDGKADIVGFGVAGTYVSLATGNGQFAMPSFSLAQFGTADSAGGWTSEDQYTRLMGDVNGDGMSDIVGFGVAGTYVSLATGNGHFAAPTFALAQFGTDNSVGGWTSEDQYTRLVGDVNGDGKADIVGFGVNGTYVALATGNGHFAAPTFELPNFGTANSAGGWTSENQYTRELADVNNDGKADIVGFGVNGTYVALATGNGHFAAPTFDVAQFGTANSAGGWTTQDQYTRLLGDVTGDHRADIVGFGVNGTYVSASHDFLVI